MNVTSVGWGSGRKEEVSRRLCPSVSSRRLGVVCRLLNRNHLGVSRGSRLVKTPRPPVRVLFPSSPSLFPIPNPWEPKGGLCPCLVPLPHRPVPRVSVPGTVYIYCGTPTSNLP